MNINFIAQSVSDDLNRVPLEPHLRSNKWNLVKMIGMAASLGSNIAAFQNSPFMPLKALAVGTVTYLSLSTLSFSGNFSARTIGKITWVSLTVLGMSQMFFSASLTYGTVFKVFEAYQSMDVMGAAFFLQIVAFNVGYLFPIALEKFKDASFSLQRSELIKKRIESIHSYFNGQTSQITNLFKGIFTICKIYSSAYCFSALLICKPNINIKSYYHYLISSQLEDALTIKICLENPQLTLKKTFENINMFLSYAQIDKVPFLNDSFDIIFMFMDRIYTPERSTVIHDLLNAVIKLDAGNLLKDNLFKKIIENPKIIFFLVNEMDDFEEIEHDKWIPHLIEISQGLNGLQSQLDLLKIDDAQQIEVLHNRRNVLNKQFSEFKSELLKFKNKLSLFTSLVKIQTEFSDLSIDPVIATMKTISENPFINNLSYFQLLKGSLSGDKRIEAEAVFPENLKHLLKRPKQLEDEK